MISGTRLKRNIKRVIGVMSCIKMAMNHVDIKIPGIGIEIMMPDLNSKHKMLSRHGGDGVGGRSVLADGRYAGLDVIFSEGGDYSAVEGGKEEDNDDDGEDSSHKSMIFWFFPEPEKLSGVEEVNFVDGSFDVAPQSHFIDL